MILKIFFYIILMTELILNKSQQESIKKLDNFIANVFDKFFILKGSAGTGKTTVITHFLNNPKFGDYKIAFSATTNKAVSVLKQISPFTNEKKYSYLTIHKLLNIKRKINKDGKEEFNMVRDNNKLIKSLSIYDYDIIIIDECSMLSNEIIESLYKLKNFKGKIIFIGDPAQLPPVNEESQIFLTKYIPTYELTEIMRYKGKIVELANKVRDLVFDSNTKIKFKDYKTDSITISKKYDKWFANYFENLKDKLLTQGNLEDLPICLTYTNRRTENINLGVRTKLFGSNSERFMEEEIIIFNNYYFLEKNEISYYTSQKSKVKKVVVGFIKPKYLGLCDSCNNNLEKVQLSCGHRYCNTCKEKEGCKLCLKKETTMDDYLIGLEKSKSYSIITKFNSIFDCLKETNIKIWELTLHNGDTINIIHEDSIQSYTQLIEILSKKIKNFRIFLKKTYGRSKSYEKLMDNIWSYLYENLIDIFADISYGYCITTHKSQGSTFNNIYVDMNNIILKNTNQEESYRCLYTAITRTSGKLNILL
jgi:hypothetical protein